MSRVALFVTCLGELVEPDVPVAVVRLLRACGAEVEVPEGQTCCGQPAWNAGFAPEAAAVARTSLSALESALAGGAEEVVVPAGSCATMVRLYWPTMFEAVGEPELAARSRVVGERVRELTEWLAADGGLAGGQVAPRSVALHRSCHLERELHVHHQPRALLEAVDGCELAAWSADDRCCGFGGAFSIKLPEASTAMADDKLDTLPEGVDEVVGTDLGCLVQLRGRAEQQGNTVAVRHIALLLAEALGLDGSGGQAGAAAP